MLKNYFYLTRCIIELNSKLEGETVVDVFTQEKEKLYLHIPSSEFPNQHLVISTNQSLPYIFVRDSHHKAKKNTIKVFKEYFPALLEKIEIAEGERLIKFSFSSGDLIFMIRGGASNIYFVNAEKELLNFKQKRNNEHALLTEFEEHNYISNFIMPEIKKYSNYETLNKDLPYINKDIIREAKSRDESFSHSILLNVISEIFEDEIKVLYSDLISAYKFSPKNYISLTSNLNCEYFSSYNKALKYFISNYYRSNKSDNEKNIIQKKIDKELEQISKRLNNLKGRLDKGCKENEFRKKGDLLSINRHLLQKGLSEISLSDADNGVSYIISLVQKHTPQDSIDYYYEKARDEKINYDKSVELYRENKEKFEILLRYKAELENDISTERMAELKSILKIKENNKSKKKKMEYDIKLRHFIINNIYHVFVGRDSKSNDLLSTKFAKQNDYWFHARGLPGSHTTLRVDNTKEGIPKDIIKKAASIAAYYSKAKTAGVAPVSYTLRKFVHKKKGMAPGKVMLSKENVILVKPEIPKSCEQVED